MYIPRPFLSAMSHAVLPPLMAVQIVRAASLAEQASVVFGFAAFCLFFQTMLPRTPSWDRWIILGSGLGIGLVLVKQNSLPVGSWSEAALGLLISLCVAAFCLIVVRRHMHEMPVLHLRSPVSDGRFLVIQGGDSRFLNHHLKCLSIPELRGQSLGIDITALGTLGLQTRNIWPRRIEDFEIFGHPVLAPITGRVSAASDGAQDQALGKSDRRAPMGNHVCIQYDHPDLGRVEICMAHLQKGSVSVATGDLTNAGQLIGAVGNSGNSSDPHLHIHVHVPSETGTPLSGTPIPFTFESVGRLRRNRIFKLPA